MSRTVEITKDGNSYIVNPNASGGGDPFTQNIPVFTNDSFYTHQCAIFLNQDSQPITNKNDVNITNVYAIIVCAWDNDLGYYNRKVWCKSDYVKPEGFQFNYDDLTSIEPFEHADDDLKISGSQDTQYLINWFSLWTAEEWSVMKVLTAITSSD